MSHCSFASVVSGYVPGADLEDEHDDLGSTLVHRERV